MSAEARSGTPYERIFGSPRFEEREFPAIRDEAKTRGLDPDVRDQFVLLGRTGMLLEEIAPEGSGPEALELYRDTLYFAFNFWQSGREIYAFDEEVARSLIESPPDLSAWTVRAPARSFYVELPPRLFWGLAEEGGTPEPVEGIFVVVDPTEAAGSGFVGIQALLVLGMRPGRAGFSVVSVRGDPRTDLDAEGPGAFRSDLPGADLAGLYSIRERAEAVLLLLRTLWYLYRHPEAVAPPEEAAPHGATRHRVRLTERVDR